jgi:hypothetical protein
MPKLYHIKLKGGVVGDKLLPLAILRVEYPEVYAKAMEKYEGREEVSQNFIPPLECLWEDVIFLSPVHPQVLHGVLVSCGHRGLIGKEAYVIDPRSLRPDWLVIYDYADGGSYSFYDGEDYLRYGRISDVTRNHYRNAAEAGKRPFLFHGITHVMYRGEICVDGLPVVRVRA